MTDEDDPQRVLAEAGAALIDAVPPAVAAWVVRCVEQILDAWAAAGASNVSAAQRAAVVADAVVAGNRAAANVATELAALLHADIDAQRSTPLQVVRAAVAYPTAVLEAAGVPGLERDQFAEERFPDDAYGLTPASLAVLDPALAEPGLLWGAAKAATHRRRHRGA